MRQPEQPWDTIRQVLLAVTQYHPDIILLTVTGTRDIMDEHNIPFSPEFNLSTVSSAVNPGIVKIRSAMKLDELTLE